MTLDIRWILEFPLVYSLWVKLIGQKWDLYVNHFVTPRPGQRILDIGCGTADVLDQFPNVDYVGIDLNPKYIEAARLRFGNKGTFKCQDLADIVVSEPHSYDIVMANGLLHHIDDAAAAHLLEISKKALKPGGYMVTFDGCFIPKQALIRKFLLKMDRGKFVRTAPEYLRLASNAFGKVNPCIREDMYHVLPFTSIIMRLYPVPVAEGETSGSRELVSGTASLR